MIFSDALLCAERGVVLVVVGRGVQSLDGKVVSEFFFALFRPFLSALTCLEKQKLNVDLLTLLLY